MATARRAFDIILIVIFAIAMSMFCSKIITLSLEPHEIRNFHQGKKIFDHPVPEAYAAAIHTEIQEELDRKDALERFINTAPIIEVASTIFLAFLLDPINIILISIFLWRFFLLRNYLIQRGWND